MQVICCSRCKVPLCDIDSYMWKCDVCKRRTQSRVYMNIEDIIGSSKIYFDMAVDVLADTWYKFENIVRTFNEYGVYLRWVNSNGRVFWIKNWARSIQKTVWLISRDMFSALMQKYFILFVSDKIKWNKIQKHVTADDQKKSVLYLVYSRIALSYRNWTNIPENYIEKMFDKWLNFYDFDILLEKKEYPLDEVTPMIELWKELWFSKTVRNKRTASISFLPSS